MSLTYTEDITKTDLQAFLLYFSKYQRGLVRAGLIETNAEKIYASAGIKSQSYINISRAGGRVESGRGALGVGLMPRNLCPRLSADWNAYAHSGDINKLAWPKKAPVTFWIVKSTRGVLLFSGK